MQKFGVEASEILSAIEEGDVSNPLAIAYRLIVDNKRIEDDQAAVDEFKYALRTFYFEVFYFTSVFIHFFFREFMHASSSPPATSAAGPASSTDNPVKPHPERIARKLILILLSPPSRFPPFYLNLY